MVGSSSHSSATSATAAVKVPSVRTSRRTCSDDLHHRSMRARTQRWHHPTHEGIPKSHSGSGHDHPGYRPRVPCSIFEGGGLWLQNDRGSVRLESAGPLGSIMDVTSPIRFSPSQQHATMPWHGDRLVLVAFHVRHLANLPVEDPVDLTDCRFSIDPGLD